MIPNTVWHSKLQEKNFAECLILPTVDEDVDAGVEDEQEVGDDRDHLAPGWPGVDVYSPLRCQVKHLKVTKTSFRNQGYPPRLHGEHSRDTKEINLLLRFSFILS